MPGLDGISGAELLKTARQQLLDYPTVRWVHAEAVQANTSAEGVEVRTADGQVLAARKLLLASGIADQLPELPGLAERWGSTVLHCPYCHGYEVGGGAIACLAAIRCPPARRRCLPTGQCHLLQHGTGHH